MPTMKKLGLTTLRLDAVAGAVPDRDLFPDVIVDLFEDGTLCKRVLISATLAERWAKNLKRAAVQARIDQRAAIAKRRQQHSARLQTQRNPGSSRS